MHEIELLTNQIASEYISFSGKSDTYKALLSPQEYLLFRKQAIEELKMGICIPKEGCISTTVSHPEPIINSQIPESKASYSTSSPSESKQDPKSERQEVPETTIIPISQKTVNEQELLKRMLSVDG